MYAKLIRFFITSAGALLLITSIAKLISGAGSAAILQINDPILNIPFRYLLIGVGIVEFVVAVCLFGKHSNLQAGLLAWLTTIVFLYRIGLVKIGYHKPCRCLGSLTEALHISPQTADTAMKIILAYLLIGSYATLFWLWRQKRQAVSATTTSGPSAPTPAP